MGKQGRGEGGGKCHRGLWLVGLGKWPVTCNARPLLLSEGIQTRAKRVPSQSGAVGRAGGVVELGTGMPGVHQSDREQLSPMEERATRVGYPIDPCRFPSPLITTSTPS